MRGGGFEWKQEFSVIDFVLKENKDSNIRTRENVFTLSVKKNIFGFVDSYSINLSFDLDLFPDINPEVLENTEKGDKPLSVNVHKLIALTPENSIEEQIIMIIRMLIEHMGGKLVETPNYSRSKYNINLVELPDKNVATKAQKYREIAIKQGAIREGRLNEFIKDGKVTKRCEINMTLKTEGTHDNLYLDKYTVIEPTTISTRTLIGAVANEEKVFNIFKWNERLHSEKYRLIATFDEKGTVFTPDTLKTALDKLTTRVYLLAKPIQKETIEYTMISSKTPDGVEDEQEVSGEITFTNGDTFDGKYKIIITDANWGQKKKIVMFIEGTYTWANGDVYKGIYSTRTYDFINNVSKKEGTYTWSDNTTYTGSSFILDKLDHKQKVLVTGFGLENIVPKTDANNEDPTTAAIEEQKTKEAEEERKINAEKEFDRVYPNNNDFKEAIKVISPFISWIIEWRQDTENNYNYKNKDEVIAIRDKINKAFESNYTQEEMDNITKSLKLCRHEYKKLLNEQRQNINTNNYQEIFREYFESMYSMNYIHKHQGLYNQYLGGLDKFDNYLILEDKNAENEITALWNTVFYVYVPDVD